MSRSSFTSNSSRALPPAVQELVTRLDSIPNSNPLWNPRTVLEICCDGRCVGYAPSKGRKCLWRLNSGNLSKFNRGLDELARLHPDADSGVVHAKLSSLARYGLCEVYHQYQLNDMVEKWKESMLEAFPQQLSRVSSFESEVSSQPATPSLQEMLARLEHRLTQLERRAPSSTTSSTVSRVSTSDISSLHLSRSSSPASRTSHASSSQSCTRTHVRRRSLVEECVICQEERSLSTLRLSELVWCKSSCGRSVHKDCFEQWRTQCEENGRSARCTICRAVWEESCECDTMEPSS